MSLILPVFRSKSNLIYFAHIPKTGGSSVENTLKKIPGIRMSFHCPKQDKFSIVSPQHIEYDSFSKAFPDDFFDWQFTIVRNPYDRIVSEYNMKKEEGVSFAAFVRAVLKRYKVYSFTRDNHIRPQSDFLSPNMEVYKLEDGLQIPISTACKKLNISFDFELRHDRKSKSLKPYKLTNSLQEKIVNHYKKDFERFNYDPNILPDTLKLALKASTDNQ